MKTITLHKINKELDYHIRIRAKKEKKSLNRTKTRNLLILKNFEKCPFKIGEILQKLEELTSGHSELIKDNLKKYIKNIFPSLKLR